MQLVRLSNLTGSLEENLTPLVASHSDIDCQISAEGMAKLGITQGSRIEIAREPKTGVLYIAVLPMPEDEAERKKMKEGRSVSKTGKFQHPTIASAIGKGKSVEITDETFDVEGLTWRTLTPFTPAVVEEEVVSKEQMEEEDQAEANGSVEAEVVPEPIAQAEDRSAMLNEMESVDARDEIPEEEY